MGKGKQVFNIVSKALIVLIGIFGTWLIWTSATSSIAKHNQIQENEFMGQHFIFNNDLLKAEDVFNEIIEIEPNHEGAKVGLATIDLVKSKYQSAEARILEVIEEHPKKPLYHKMLGIINLGQKRFDEAKEQFELVQSFDDNEEIEELINKTIYIQSMDGENNSFFNMNDTMQELTNEVLMEWQEITKAKLGKKADLFETITRIQEGTMDADLDTIEEFLKTTDHKYYDDPQILKSLGKAYLNEDRLEEAIEHLEKAYDKNFNDEETAALLSEAWIDIYATNNFDIIEEDEEIRKKNDDIRDSIEDLYDRLNDLSSSEQEKIEKINKKIEKGNKELRDNCIEYIKNKIVNISMNIDNSIYLLEKLAKLQYIVGDSKGSEASIDNIIKIVHEYKEEYEDLFILLKSIESSQTDDELIDNNQLIYSSKVVDKFTRYMPTHWGDKKYNQDWNNYLKSYLNFTSKNIHIVKVDKESFPEVTAYIRINSESDEKILTERDFKIVDSGNEINDFKLVQDDDSEINIIILLDQSGSMGGNRLSESKEAAVQFIQGMSNREKVLFASFDNSVRFKTDFLSSEYKDELIGAIYNTYTNGGTNIYGSLDQCLDVLDARYGKKAIVILTDGEDENKDISVIKKAKNLGVPIFAIGLESSFQTLQEICHKTGGEFFYAKDTERLKLLYDLIRKQLGNEYIVRYEVADVDNGDRQLFVTLKDQDISQTKYYSIDSNNAAEEKDIDTLSDIVIKPNYVYKESNINANTSVSIDIQNYEIKQPIDIFLNNYKINDDLITYEENSIKFKLSNYISAGSYNITLRDAYGKEYKIINGITIKDRVENREIAVGHATLKGDITQYTYRDLAALEGSYMINDLLFVEGAINIDNQNNRIYGDGLLSTSIQGKKVNLHNGSFNLNTESMIMDLDSNKASKFYTANVSLERIDILDNKLNLQGYIGFRQSDGDYEWYSTEEFALDNDSIKITLNNFDYNNQKIRINNATLVFNNDTWNGEGQVTINNSLLRITGVGKFNIVYNDISRSYEVGDINVDFHKADKISIAGRQITFTPIEAKITDTSTSFPKIKIKGSAEYISKTNAVKLEGNLELDMGTAKKILAQGNLSNDNFKLSLDGDIDYYGYNGKGTIECSNESSDNISANGDLAITYEGIYGVFEGKLNNKEDRVFEVSDDLIMITDGSGISQRYSLSGINYDNTNLKLLEEDYEVTEINLPANQDDYVIKMTWSQGDTDFVLQTPKGEEITPKTAHEHDMKYVKKDLEAYYVITNSSEYDKLKVNINDINIGEYKVGIYSVNKPPSIKVNDVKVDVNELDIDWEITDKEDSTKVDLYLYDENTENKLLLEDNIHSYYYSEGLSVGLNHIQPGDYVLIAEVSDGKNVPTIYVHDEAVTVLNHSLPSKVVINRAYRMNKNVVIEPDLRSQPNLYGFKVYELNDDGTVNRVNYLEIKKQEVIVLNNMNLDKQYKVVGYNSKGQEGISSDAIVVGDLDDESPITNVMWQPDIVNINKNIVDLKIDFIQEGYSKISLNGYEIVTLEESTNFTIDKLTEGYNEILLQNQTNDLRNEIWKDYIVDSRPPILHLDKKYDNLFHNNSVINVSGKTEPGAKLKINDTEIEVNNNGDFLHELKLELGQNKITIISIDEFGNSAQYDGIVKYYGNSKLYIILGFLAAYLVTILLFILAYRIRKKKLIRKSLA